MLWILTGLTSKPETVEKGTISVWIGEDSDEAGEGQTEKVWIVKTNELNPREDVQ